MCSSDLWNAVTIVLPEAKLSGSTSVACCPVLALVNGSVLMRTGAAVAPEARVARTSAAAAALVVSVFRGVRTAAERSYSERVSVPPIRCTKNWTAGPMSTANATVPTPTTPPSA